jgi:hypothetical protein
MTNVRQQLSHGSTPLTMTLRVLGGPLVDLLGQPLLSCLLSVILAVTVLAAESPDEAGNKPPVNKSDIRPFRGTEYGTITSPGGEMPQQPLGSAVPSEPLTGPGEKVGDTWYDYQRNGSMRRMVVGDTITIGKGDLTLFVSGSYMDLPGPVMQRRKDWFWMYDCFYGTHCDVEIQTDDEYAGYTTTLITGDARAIVVGHNRINPNPLYQTHVYWQNLPGECNFIHECRVPDGIADSCEYTPTSGYGESVWPAAAWQEGADTVLHVLAVEAELGVNDPMALMYFRAVNPELSCVWDPPICLDVVYTLGYDVDATNDGRVILAWTAPLPCKGANPCGSKDPYPQSGCECRQNFQWDNDEYYTISEDYGATWQPRVNVTKHTDWCETDTTELRPYRPYTDVSVLFDSQNKWHIVWSARSWPGDANCGDGNDAGLLSNRIFHYSQDLAPYGIQGIRTVHNAEWDQQVCNGGAWSLNACKQTVSECNGKLYVLFTQFNDGPAGIFDDCAHANNPGYPTGAANGELYVCVSNDWGVSWDKARDITNTRQRWIKQIPCDYVGGPGGPCPSEHWSSMRRFGTNYVGSFPNNKVIPVGGSDNGWFLDVQYTDDPSAGGSVQGEGWMQNADVKWIRLACVDPITCPAISLSPPEIGYPCWTKHGVQKDVDVDVENSGNATLNYTLTKTELTGPGGWLTYSSFDGSVPSGLGNVETGTVHINTGGMVNNPGTIVYLKGHLDFNVTDPCAADASLKIECWVTDTLIEPIWDTVFTVCAGDTVLGLTVANTGNFGNMGKDSVTMDYTKWGGDTCANASTYLYDGSPVVGYIKGGSDTLCNFSIFNETPVHENGFVPFGDYTPTTDMGEYEVFESGPFVTHDSQVVVEKVWYAPKMTSGSCSFVIECIKVYGRIGSVSGLRVGEAIDWDIPSDAGVDNSSGFDYTLKLIYQQGAEYDTVNDQECENDRRFGGINFLEGYHNDLLYKTDPYGAYTRDNATYVYPASGFVAEELYTNMSMSGYSPYTSSDPDSEYVDLHTVMTFDTGLTVSPTEVYKFYVGIITHWNGNLASLLAELDEAIQWYNDHIKPTVVGACCVGASCNVTTEALCTDGGGEYQGDWTDCDPNPCSCCNHDGIRGDVNMSTSGPNVADVTRLVSYIKNIEPTLPCFEEADVNATGTVNVSDVVYLAAYIKGIGPAPLACP